MRRCKHRWQADARRFHPPAGVTNIKGISEDFFREILYGITVVELRCEHCGMLTSQIIPGDAR